MTYNYEAIEDSGTCTPLDDETVGSDRCYTVTVQVWDGLDANRVEVEETDADDTITLKIGVRDHGRKLRRGRDGDGDGARGQYDPGSVLGRARNTGPDPVTPMTYSTARAAAAPSQTTTVAAPNC